MRRALRQASQRRDAGFTLVEVMMAVVILGILAASVLGLILNAQSQEVTNRARIAASNLAAREIDLIRDEFHRSHTAPVEIATYGTAVNPHPLDGATLSPTYAGGGADEPLVLDNIQFTVTRSVEWNLFKDGQSACEGGELVSYPTLGVTVTVTWPHMGSVKPVTSTTQLAPDKGFGVPSTDSFVAVAVYDQDGQPSAGRTVQVTGGGQTKTQPTDASGCAVVEVSPAATGTDYTASVIADGYVDISSQPNPSKNVGTLGRGQLNNNVQFQIAKAGTIHVDLVDSAGHPVTSPPANAVVTLTSAEAGGTTSTISVPITGSSVERANLWPAVYGAYYGQTAPAGGYQSGELTAGGTLSLTVTLRLATGTVTNLVPGTQVWAVAGSPSACTTTGAISLGTADAGGNLALPGGGLVPDEYTLFANFPYAACSTGPDVTLAPGDNGTIAWEYSTFTYSGLPTGSTVYAAEKSKVTSPTTWTATSTCPPTVQAGATVTVQPTGNPLPAGTWVVWAVSSTGQCAYPSTPPLVNVIYGQDATTVFGGHQVKVTLSGITYIGSYTQKYGNRTTTYYYPTVVATQTPPSGLTCSASGIKVTATNSTVSKLNLTPGSNMSSGKTVSAATTAQQGTWYFVANDENDYGSGYGAITPTAKWDPSSCKLVGTVTVDTYSSDTTVTYAVSN